VEATLRRLNEIQAVRERRTRTELLQAAADSDVTLDVDNLDEALGAFPGEWPDLRAKLLLALLAAMTTGNLGPIEARHAASIASRRFGERPTVAAALTL
jgi:hypothetical protein